MSADKRYKQTFVMAIDNIMLLHKNHTGDTTSYSQLNYIRNISQTNKRRFFLTDPEIQRDEVIAGHVNSTKPTIIFSSTTLYSNSINSHTTLEFERKEERLCPRFIRNKSCTRTSDSPTYKPILDVESG